MTAVIFLNGPPRSGKDTICNWLLERNGEDFRRQRMSTPLKLGVHALFGMPFLGPEAFEEVKDEPQDCFCGLTPREAYIECAETYMKLKYGQDIFGKIWINQYVTSRQIIDDGYSHRVGAPEEYDNKISVIPDCGFPYEMEPIIKHFGKENCMLINLHREGKTFATDSRGYVSNLCGIEETIYNDWSKQKLFDWVDYILSGHGVWAELYKQSS